jgi:hypothetical protein
MALVSCREKPMPTPHPWRLCETYAPPMCPMSHWSPLNSPTPSCYSSHTSGMGPSKLLYLLTPLPRMHFTSLMTPYCHQVSTWWSSQWWFPFHPKASPTPASHTPLSWFSIFIFSTYHYHLKCCIYFTYFSLWSVSPNRSENGDLWGIFPDYYNSSV